MALSHIEHFLILTRDMAATRDWYAKVLGMEEGPHPDFTFPVHWMYLGGVDVVHIGQSGAAADPNQAKYLGRLGEDKGQGTGAVDHIAFRATGLRQMLDHLKRHDVQFTERRANNQALYQLFLYDPNGIKVELNFAATEAAAEGIEPELMASEFKR